MSSSCSSTPKPEKLKSLIVAMEESKEKETTNNNLTLGSPQEVTSGRRIENPSFGYGPVRRGRDIMEFYPPKSNKIYSCRFCMKGFSTPPHQLGGHQNAHKQEREWDKQLKVMESDFSALAYLNPYLDRPHLLLGGYSQDALSNENHLGITLQPFKRLVYPSFNSGVIGRIAAMNTAVIPRLTPTRFFSGNTSTNCSASKVPGPFPSNNNMYPLIPRNVLPFPPPRTSRDLVPRENVSSDENLILKVGMNNVVEIDDDDDDEDHPEEGTCKSWGTDLSLSL